MNQEELLSWISKHFSSRSVEMLSDGVDSIQCFSWQDNYELGKILNNLLEEEGLGKEEEATIVFESRKPQIRMSMNRIAERIESLNETEVKWWVIPDSRAWLVEFRNFGELWFCRIKG